MTMYITAYGAAAVLFAAGAGMIALAVWFGLLMWADERAHAWGALPAAALGAFGTAVLAISAARFASWGVELLREARASELHWARRVKAERSGRGRGQTT